MPAHIIDSCCQLLGSGRPFSEILAETKRISATPNRSNNQPSTQVRTIEHAAGSVSAARKRWSPWAIGFWLTGLAATSAGAVGLMATHGATEPPIIIATAPIPQPNFTSIIEYLPVVAEGSGTAALSTGELLVSGSSAGSIAGVSFDGNASIKFAKEDPAAAVIARPLRALAQPAGRQVTHRAMAAPTEPQHAAVSYPINQTQNSVRSAPPDYPVQYAAPVGTYVPRLYPIRVPPSPPPLYAFRIRPHAPRFYVFGVRPSAPPFYSYGPAISGTAWGDRPFGPPPHSAN